MNNKSVCNRVSSGLLEDRLDAEYYTKDLLENEAKISHFQEVLLSDLVDKNKPNNIADLTSNGSFEYLRGIKFNEVGGIPFIRTQNLMDGFVDVSDIIYVNNECRSMVSKSLCEAGDFIVCRKGKVGAASSVTQSLNGAVISENITRFSLKKDQDSDFIAAFFNSLHGRKRLVREATGVIQKWINTEKLRTLRIILLTPMVQKYIGDKVRQAERLRAWAKSLESEFTKALKITVSEAFEDKRTDRKHMIAPSNEITYTLNPGAFDEERVRVQRYLKSLDGMLVKDVAVIYGQNATKISSNTTYIGLDAIASNSCQLTPSTVGEAEVSGACRYLPEGTVIAKLRPYLNKVSYIPSHLAGAVGSTELLCVKPTGNLSGWYLYGVLKSELVLKQLRPVATGATHPRIDQDDIYHLVIPILDNHQELGEYLKLAQSSYFISKNLTNAAKLLVEGLIEGLVTETELIAAQQGLEAGDTEADAAILRRLKTDGLDGKGQPLFGDVERVYELLVQANLERE